MVGSVTEATSYQEWLALGGEDTKRNVSGDLGKDQFLQLLVTQLKHQDPTAPSDNNEFIAQLAQFSSLESMQNMTNSIEAMAQQQSYSLIGKFVVATAYVDGVEQDIPGVVESIFTRGGVAYAQVGEYAVPVSSITQVYDSDFLTPNQSLLETANQLIGRQVKATSTEEGPVEVNGIPVLDDEGNPLTEEKTITISGVVTRVAAEDNVMYAYINDGSGEEKRVAVGNIFDVGEVVTAAAEKKDDPDLKLQEDPDPQVTEPTDDPEPQVTDPPATDPEDGTEVDTGSGSGTIIVGSGTIIVGGGDESGGSDEGGTIIVGGE